MKEDRKQVGWQEHGPGIYSVEVRPQKKQAIEQTLHEWLRRLDLESAFDNLQGEIKRAVGGDVKSADG